MSKEKLEADVYGEYFGNKTANVKYEDPNGKVYKVSFKWLETEHGSGSYWSESSYGVKTTISEEGVFTSNEVYSNTKNVGSSSWQASRYTGSSGSDLGILTFEEFLRNKNVFDDVENEQLREILYKAQDCAREGLGDFYKNYDNNKNKLTDTRKRVAKKIDDFTKERGIDKLAKKVGVDITLSDKRLSKPLRNVEKKISDLFFNKSK